MALLNFQPIQYISPTQAASAATFARPIKANFEALSSTNAGSGSELIGVNRTTTNYSQSGDSIKDHLDGIDTKLGTYNATTIVATSNPSNYTKVTNSTQGHLLGIDTALGTKEPAISSGATTQYIRGDKSLATLNATVVPASSTPTNYTPITSSVEGHLKGIDTKLGGISAVTVVATATPTNYTRITTSVEGHMMGIDTALGTKAPTNAASFTGTTTVSAGSFTRQVYFGGEVDNGNSSTAKTVNWTWGNKQKVTLTGNCTFTFTAPTGITNLQLRCIGDGTVRTITWPATVKWPDGSAPIMTGTLNKWDIISMFYDGTNYSATIVQNFG